LRGARLCSEFAHQDAAMDADLDEDVIDELTELL
jgi:hypothetical protein